MRKNLLCNCPRLLSIAVLLFFASASFAGSQQANREYYQIIVYHFKDANQEKIIDNYLQNAFIPALHKMEISKVGVFKTIANDTADDKTLYVFIPVKSLDQLATVTNRLETDADYQAAGKEYIEAGHDHPPYTRMETILLHAFTMAPEMQMPQLNSTASERVFELRSYEGPTEKLYHNKVQMFNEGGEVDLFKRLGFNAIFYAEVLAGSRMPNLMYMTSFENMQERETHWKTFTDDAQWKQLSSMLQYQNNVSKADIILLHPAEYSDI